jgi:multidrug efflux pump subunit AcrA (membrane-fusion protein)
MPNNMKRFIPIFIIILGIVIYGIYYLFQTTIFGNGTTASGTIEANEVRLGVVTGGIVDRVLVNEGDSVKKDQLLAVVKQGAGTSSGSIRSPLNGVVLLRAADPGEITTAGGALLVVADLTEVTLTIYVPEAQYGQIYLGQILPVTVDSFPDREFYGRVTYISDEAEFTPRNAQTIQNRKNTVYAVKLTIPNPDLDLKPGMPADATLFVK